MVAKHPTPFKMAPFAEISFAVGNWFVCKLVALVGDLTVFALEPDIDMSLSIRLHHSRPSMRTTKRIRNNLRFLMDIKV
jgi:hypothetical protein